MSIILKTQPISKLCLMVTCDFALSRKYTELVCFFRPEKQMKRMPNLEMLNFMRDISLISAFCQLILLIIVMFTGDPGIFQKERGFMYISDNFCSKQLIAALFMIATIPTWALLACSVALEVDKPRRKKVLALISLPFPLGIGIVFFSICTTPNLHYVYVNAFVASVGGVHYVVASTAGHVLFLQTYFGLLIGTAICGLIFMVLAFSENEAGIQRNSAVIAEYLAITGFIVLNSFTADRIQEHVDI